MTSNHSLIALIMQVLGMSVMNKLIVMIVLMSTMTACAYDPVQYEKMRFQENAQHNKLMGA